MGFVRKEENVLSRLVGMLSGGEEKVPERPRPAPGPEAGEAVTAAAQPKIPSVMRREAMLGRDRRVAGYTFMLRREQADLLPDMQRLHDETLLDNLQRMDITRLLGQRLAFVPVVPATLFSPAVDAWPTLGTVWILRLDDPACMGPDLIERLAALRARGCKFAAQSEAMVRPEYHALMPAMDYVLMDVSGEDIPVVTSTLATLSRLASGKLFVATDVQTLEAFHMCHKLQFALFMGPFITRRETLDNPVLGPSRAKVLDLMNRVRTGAEQPVLAAQFRQDPALSVRLLRYVNSPGMGLTNKIGGIEQALMVMGQDKLYRWLTMILFTGGQSHELDSAVLENALTRGRMAEQLAGRALFAKARDEIFVAGLFSLLDVVMGMPMEKVLGQISLPAEITEAILARRGPYAPYLALAIACEQDDQTGIGALAREIGREVDEVNSAHMDALLWAQQVSDV